MNKRRSGGDRFALYRVNIRPSYLNVFENHLGRTVAYYRHNGRTVELVEKPGTPEYLAEYLAARNGTPAPIGIDKRNNASGTWNAAIAGYMASSAYTTLKRPSAYNAGIAILRTMFGDLSMRACKPFMVKDLIDKQVALGKWGLANALLSVTRKVVEYASEREWCNLDLTKIKKAPPPTKGRRAWKTVEVERWRSFYSDTRSEPRTAMEIVYYFGCRGRSDATRLGWSNTYTDDKGQLWIRFEQTKTGGAIDMPVLDPDLLACLAHRPKADGDVVDLSGVTTLPWLRNKSGRQFSPDDFGHRWREWATAAGLPADFTAHGARKSIAVDATDFGVVAQDAAHLTGHEDLDVFRDYAKAHSAKLGAERAAIALVAGRRGRSRRCACRRPTR
jgi:integrase